MAKLLVVCDSMGGALSMMRHFNDKRPIIKELPKKIKALVIHKRYYINTYLDSGSQNVAPSENITIECSIITENYNVGEKQLYEPIIIIRYILKSKANVVVSLL